MKNRSIFFYVSGHGFGHATRSAEVIRSINRLAPELSIHVRSAAPPHIFQDADCQHTLHQGLYDIGVIQSDGLTMDIPATIKAYRQLSETFENLEKTEIEAADKLNVCCILADIPSFAFRVSSKLGVPGVAISNFSWDWIYEYWVEEYPAISSIVKSIQDDYSRCSILFRLPFSEKLPAFADQDPVPMIGRSAVLSAEDVRNRLNLPATQSVVLLSFGGMGLNSANLQNLKNDAQYYYVSIGNYGAPCREIQLDELKQNKIRYPDLVAAVDAVVTKPGYGIVSECVANQTPILYTDRGPFREYGVLTEQMQNMIPTQYIDRSKFQSGQWTQALDQLLSKYSDYPKVPCNGADVIAHRVLERIS